MSEAVTKAVGRQAVIWESLEGWVREQVQQLTQELLEPEVTEFLVPHGQQRLPFLALIANAQLAVDEFIDARLAT